jgi:hypothetical protein
MTDPRQVPDVILGDGPCDDCGDSVFMWWTDNVVWNAVIREAPRYGSEVHGEGFLCARCFVRRAAEIGLRPTAWRLVPDWPWTTTQEGQ